ncbi:MAG: hypothetical protein IKF36_06105 [Bacilli bacterium]|nr:hypothetical protein [Bacilli bacterium]
MKRVLSLLMVFVAVFSVTMLVGCGSKADLSKYAGTYEGQYTKLVGDDTKDTSDKFSVELKEDGTGSSTRDGATYDITWSMDGDKFEMTEKFAGMKIEYTGTLKNGELNIFNGPEDDDWTYNYVYKKK